MHSRARRLHTSRATRVAVAPARGRGDDDRAHLLQARHRERGRHRQSVRGLRMIRFGGVDDTDTIDHTPSRRIRRPPEQPPGDRGVRRPDARQRSLRAPDTPLVTGERYPQPTIHFSTPAGSPPSTSTHSLGSETSSASGDHVQQSAQGVRSPAMVPCVCDVPVEVRFPLCAC